MAELDQRSEFKNSIYSSARYQVSGPNVIRESIEGEVIIVHLDSGNYYSLRGTGAVLWEQLEASKSISEIVNQLRCTYAASEEVVYREVIAFVEQLIAEDLISVTNGEASTGNSQPIAATDSKLPFLPPLLEKFSDMQELLLLDPVHEVGQDGWQLREDETRGDQSVH